MTEGPCVQMVRLRMLLSRLLKQFEMFSSWSWCSGEWTRRVKAGQGAVMTTIPKGKVIVITRVISL